MPGRTRASSQSLETVLPQGRGDAFLADHHLEAASWLTTLLERASLRQRVTMSYDPGRVGQGKGSAAGREITDSVADARKRLARVAGGLPKDCWGVLVDVCLYDKGLQQIETERRWPRRSAKLVFRIGLEQVATLLGVEQEAIGPDRAKQRAWLPERPPMFQTPEN